MDANLSRREVVRAIGAFAAGVAVPSRLSGYDAVTPPVPDLTGKTPVVRTAGRPLDTLSIVGGCSFKTQSFRLFLTGTNVPGRHAVHLYGLRLAGRVAVRAGLPRAAATF